MANLRPKVKSEQEVCTLKKKHEIQIPEHLPDNVWYPIFRTVNQPQGSLASLSLLSFSIWQNLCWSECVLKHFAMFSEFWSLPYEAKDICPALSRGHVNQVMPQNIVTNSSKNLKLGLSLYLAPRRSSSSIASLALFRITVWFPRRLMYRTSDSESS